MEQEKDLAAAAGALDRAHLVAVSSGAGISKESGIPTFREAQSGLWARYDPEQLATPHAFRRNPDLVWSWYMYRLDLASSAEPNPGHRAVAELEGMVPRLVVLTQNVDGLHERAGSRDIVELHGSLHRFRCFDDCQGNPTPVALETITHEREHAPRCPHCGGRVRPGVVWFGETLPPGTLERAFEVAATCDVMLVVGTSGIVQPAAQLPVAARQAGATVIEINPEPSAITRLADIRLHGPSGVMLPRLVETLRQLRDHKPRKDERP